MATEPSTVTIPLSLAVALFDCYFGTGPRRAESLAAARESQPPPSHPSPSPSLLPPTAAPAPPFSSGGWVPRGSARRTQPATMTSVDGSSPIAEPPHDH